MSCVFCNYNSGLFIAENAYFFAVPDMYPVSKGHTLIVSKRHVRDFFQLSEPELSALHGLAVAVKIKLEEQHAVNGFNLAMNCGRAAGQSVDHFHLHIIPRYHNDGRFPPSSNRESIF